MKNFAWIEKTSALFQWQKCSNFICDIVHFVFAHYYSIRINWSFDLFFDSMVEINFGYCFKNSILDVIPIEYQCAKNDNKCIWHESNLIGMCNVHFVQCELWLLSLLHALNEYQNHPTKYGRWVVTMNMYITLRVASFGLWELNMQYAFHWFWARNFG